MPTNLATRHTWSTKAHLNFGWHPGHLPPSLSLSQHVRPDVKGNIVEGRGSPNNERYTTSPNLILQQMAKCNLWPWQIAVLVKPSSTIRGKKKWEKQTNEVGWNWKWRRQNTKMGETNIWAGDAGEKKKKGGLNKKQKIDMKTEWGFKTWSYELNLTDLQRINNVNFSGSDRNKWKLKRDVSKKPWKAN